MTPFNLTVKEVIFVYGEQSNFISRINEEVNKAARHIGWAAFYLLLELNNLNSYCFYFNNIGF